MNVRLALLLAAPALAFAAEPPVPQFRAVTLDAKVQIGYGLAIEDVDGDKAPDILLADKKQFVWYRNPGKSTAGDPAAWSRHVLAENLTEKDNVCIAAQDIDGDGKAEIAVGAEWNPGDTEKSGAVFFLQAPADRTQPWKPIRFPEVEPTTHRMRWIKVAPAASLIPTAQPIPGWALLVQPLHGRGNKAGEGAPVKVLLYHPPRNAAGGLAPESLPWKSELVDESLYSSHNFNRLSIAGPAQAGMGDGLLLGGKEGLVSLHRRGDQWQRTIPAMVGEKPAGVGEVRVGSLLTGTQFITTVEPMHGNTLAIYLPRKAGAAAIALERRVLTDRLVEGHALACGNLLGGLANLTASDQIVVGWRGKIGTVGSPTGVAVWSPLDAQGEKWRETVIDPDGMACEDLMLADLDGDNRLDIVASGRATRNLKVYFNQTPLFSPRTVTPGTQRE
jgi:hypothetical protein